MQDRKMTDLSLPNFKMPDWNIEYDGMAVRNKVKRLTDTPSYHTSHGSVSVVKTTFKVNGRKHQI